MNELFHSLWGELWYEVIPSESAGVYLLADNGDNLLWDDDTTTLIWDI